MCGSAQSKVLDTYALGKLSTHRLFPLVEYVFYSFYECQLPQDAETAGVRSGHPVLLHCLQKSCSVESVSSYQFPHKILFEFDKGDSWMASSSIHDVGIQHSNFKHMKVNFLIPNISLHKPAANCHALITQINSFHMGVVQVNQLWLCDVLPLPLPS